MLIPPRSGCINRANGTPVVVAVHHLLQFFLSFVEVGFVGGCQVSVSLGVGGLRILLALDELMVLLFLLDGEAVVLTCVLSDSDEAVVVLLLVDTAHVLVEVVVDILATVARIKSSQEQLVVILLRELLQSLLKLVVFAPFPLFLAE
jgi:hypothetical protein